MPNLKGKVTVITGASSGIGAAVAEHFASSGAFLALTGRDANQLEVVKRKCISNGLSEEQVLTVRGDVTSKSDLENLVSQTVGRFEKIDILVNNAGILAGLGDFVSVSLDEFDKVMNVNLRGTLQLTQLCLPYLIKTKGTIVNVSSIAGICAFPQVTHYCMSKAAMDQFTKCLALEMAPHGVRVNSVNPGVIVTEVHKRAGMSPEDYAKFLEQCKNTHALGRVGEPIEVAKAIAFLASDDSSFTTGELLPIDGGRGLMVPR